MKEWDKRLIDCWVSTGIQAWSQHFPSFLCQPTAFWMAAQSLTFESAAAAVHAAFKCRSVWATVFHFLVG